MSGKLFDRLVAAAVFVYALVLYGMTIAQTTSFWDSGEFTAISNGLQVSHPPGAPFYMLVGRIFSMAALLFSGLTDEPVAYAVAFMSVVASALTILLTHLVLLRLVRIWQGHPATWTWAQRLAANSGGVIGALTLAASDSFWFNAVEAEVYAMSILFTVLVVWLGLVWRDATRAEEASMRARGEHPFGLHADRYLLAIAYLFGLAIGIHLLNVLTLFFLALIVFFQKIDRPEWTTGQRLKALVWTALGSSALFLVIYPGIVQTLPTLAGASGAPVLFLVAVVGLLIWAVVWTQRRRMPVANLLALSVTLVMIGYSSYALIFVRSAANPPIDENSPDNAEAIVSYLKREQYGSTPLLSGPTYDNRTGQIDDSRDVLFPRRHSQAPAHLREYGQYASDMAFFWRYQMGHMYWRYFLWQFVGRAADTQDAGWTAGLGPAPPTDGLTPSEIAGRTVYFGFPLLLGLIGLAFHVQRDWRRALAVGALFFITGAGIILYLNQTPFQPRERDYAFVASFFAYALWVGIGATGLIALTFEALSKHAEAMRRAAAVAVAAVLFVAVPGWMTVENYDAHDRTGNRLPSDFAWNLLQSTAPNAILFTNGDNDTFPLWYLQETMGVRRDVRVVNLSLLNTDWYIRQLRDQWSRESAPLPISISDAQLATLQPTLFEPADVQLPVDRARFGDADFAGAVDLATVPEAMTWRLNGQPLGDGRSVLYVSDLMVLNILQTAAAEGWQRPIYFASTVARDSELDLQPFFQNEGLARRVVPFRRETQDPDGVVVPAIALARVNTFRFRGLADPSVYYDENSRNMADGYRTRMGALAAGMAAAGRPDAAREVLERVEREIPFTTIPGSFGALYTLAEGYRAAGQADRATAVLGRAEAFALGQLRRVMAGPGGPAQEQAFQYVQFVQTAYLLGGAYDEAAAFSQRIATAVGDPRLARTAAELRQEATALQRARDSVEARPAAPPAVSDTTR